MTRVRLVAAAALMCAALAIAAAPATAHPLGNFSVNHLTQVRISEDRIDVRYVLDQAEIPTFRERGLDDAAVLRRKRDEVARRLTLTIDGRAVALRASGPAVLTHPAGQGGLRTTRLELPLGAPARGAHSVAIHDGTFPDRVGWKAIQALPGSGTAVRTGAPATDPTGGLRRYPADLLESPSEVRDARFAVAPGDGTVAAGSGRTGSGGGEQADAGFAGLLDGDGVLLLLLLAAFGWGALHALSPGHGKAMVAAYLVGTRGSTRDAVILGATVTVTHTAGVVALGVVALGLSAWILPEQLYPWLNLASGLLVVGVGVAVLRGRARRLAHHHHHDHGDHHHGLDQHHGLDDHGPGHHDHGPGHHDHGPGHHDRPDRGDRRSDHHDRPDHHDHGLGHHDWPDHHDHGPGHHDQPDRGDRRSDRRSHRRSLLAMGASAGLIPCPSALVVLLGAVAQHRVGLGLVLIVAFSLGLAATLTALGIAVVHAGRVLGRLPVPGRLVAAIPAASAILIVVVGLALTAQAVPQLA